jgi:general secretion pathway protein G
MPVSAETRRGELKRIPTAARLALAAAAMLLIAGLVVRAIARATQQAKVSRAEAEIAILKRALDRYYVDNGAYPSALGALYGLDGQKQTDARVRYARRYVVDLPERDPWGNHFYYESDGKMYVLKSYGADGNPGGSGDDADIVAAEGMSKG